MWGVHSARGDARSSISLQVPVSYTHLNSLRKVKSDPADARKIARYTLDNWTELRQYSGMDNTRTCLLYTSKRGSGGKFRKYLNLRQLPADGFLSLTENKSL